MFIKYQGKTVTRWLPVTPSTAFTKGEIVSWSSGLLIPATSSTTALSHAGVIKKSIASTDSDYASSRLVPVEVPVEKDVKWLADFTATLLSSDVGAQCDLTDGLTVNRGANSVHAVFIDKFISTVKGLVVIAFGAGQL